ncbi:MAG: hypothetical protein WCO82_01775 [Sphingomonadales bacterium]|jgi:hypothetical protein
MIGTKTASWGRLRLGLLLPVLLAGASQAQAGGIPNTPPPVGKIDPSKLPPVSKLKPVKPIKLKLTLTDVVWQKTGNFFPDNADGSFELSGSGYVIASVAVDAAPGVDTAASLVLSRFDKIWCPANTPATSINPLWAVTVPGAAQGQQLVAKAGVSGDTYFSAGTCAQGKPERAETTFIATVTTKSGAVYASKQVVTASHFNE